MAARSALERARNRAARSTSRARCRCSRRGSTRCRRLSPRAIAITPVTIVEIDDKSLDGTRPLAVAAHAARAVDAQDQRLHAGGDRRRHRHARARSAVTGTRTRARRHGRGVAAARSPRCPRTTPSSRARSRPRRPSSCLADAPAAATQPLRAAPILVARCAAVSAEAATMRARRARCTIRGALSSLATLNDAASGWGLISVPDQPGHDPARAARGERQRHARARRSRSRCGASRRTRASLRLLTVGRRRRERRRRRQPLRRPSATAACASTSRTHDPRPLRVGRRRAERQRRHRSGWHAIVRADRRRPRLRFGDYVWTPVGEGCRASRCMRNCWRT